MEIKPIQLNNSYKSNYRCDNAYEAQFTVDKVLGRRFVPHVTTKGTDHHGDPCPVARYYQDDNQNDLAVYFYDLNILSFFATPRPTNFQRLWA